VGAIRHAQAGFPRKGLRASSRAIKARVEAVEVLLYQTSMVMAIAWPDRRAHEGAARTPGSQSATASPSIPALPCLPC
jgi:hypothetical protein